MRLWRRVRAGVAFLAIASVLTVAGMTTASATPASGTAAISALHGLSVPGTLQSSNQKVVAGAVTSANWSGYADVKSKFTKVSAQWTEPSITCKPHSLKIVVFWVGIDGYTSKTVEQDGTLGECYQGVAYYGTWWEMYPTNDIQLMGLNVSPGDQITSSVVRSGSSYTLSVKDASKPKNSFSVREQCLPSSCDDSNAEWIAEAPSASGGELALAKFSTWSVSSAAVTGASTTGSISSFTNKEITMVDRSQQPMSSPSALNSKGNAFTVSWVSSA